MDPYCWKCNKNVLNFAERNHEIGFGIFENDDVLISMTSWSKRADVKMDLRIQSRKNVWISFFFWNSSLTSFLHRWNCRNALVSSPPGTKAIVTTMNHNSHRKEWLYWTGKISYIFFPISSTFPLFPFSMFSSFHDLSPISTFLFPWSMKTFLPRLLSWMTYAWMMIESQSLSLVSRSFSASLLETLSSLSPSLLS